MLAAVALAAFVASMVACVYILVPRRGKFVFSISGPVLYEGLYDEREDLGEVHRRLAYALQGFWDDNDETSSLSFAHTALERGPSYSRSCPWSPS